MREDDYRCGTGGIKIKQHGCCVNPRTARGEHSGAQQDVAKQDVCYLSAQDAHHV